MDEEGEAAIIRKPWTAAQQLRKLLRYWSIVEMSEPLEEAAHGFFFLNGGSHTETVLWARSSVHTVHELPVRLQCKAVRKGA